MASTDAAPSPLERELAYYKRKLDEVSGTSLKLDYAISALQHDLKQKRQGFALLVDLQRGIRIDTAAEALFAHVVASVRGTLEMERAAILTAVAGDPLRYEVAYNDPPTKENGAGGLTVAVTAADLAAGSALLGNSSAAPHPTLDALRARLDLPFLVAVTVMVPDGSPVLLVAGRSTERPPFRPMLDAADVATLTAVGGLITASLQNRHAAMVTLANTVLAEKNDELAATLVQLRDTQQQLLESEKLAALGGLVAGVAHEINTPVGIGLTAGSTLVDQAEAFRALFASGGMKRSSLESFIETVIEGSGLILTNLHRTADLVASFKQVAVDQSSEAARQFDLRAYLEDILRSLGPNLKRTPHTVEVDVPESLVIDGYPGALAQTVTNLVMNALVHAYPDDQAGVMRLRASLAGRMVEITFSDDGRGIPPDVLPRVFEPFFTTRRGQGGSGLGLSIVHNIVTRTLRGQISVASEVGVGTTFTIRIPIAGRGPHG